MSAKSWAMQHCCCNRAMRRKRDGARKMRQYRKAETRANRRRTKEEMLADRVAILTETEDGW